MERISTNKMLKMDFKEQIRELKDDVLWNTFTCNFYDTWQVVALSGAN